MALICFPLPNRFSNKRIGLNYFKNVALRHVAELEDATFQPAYFGFCRLEIESIQALNMMQDYQ